jgi:hypothetical protein
LPSPSNTYTSAFNGTWPKTLSVTTAVGDLLVAMASSDEYGGTSDQFLTPTGGTSLTWTLKQFHNLTSNSVLYVWTATATTAETFTFSCNTNGGAATGVIQVTRWAGTGGVGNTSKGNAGPGSAPSLSLTTAAAGSAIIGYFVDWSETSPTGHTWRTINSITPASGSGETMATDVSGHAVWYGAYWTDAGTAAAKTTGLTTPNQKWVGVAVEVKASATNAGTADVPLSISITATGANAAQGTANVGVSIAIAATGSRASQGTADVPLSLSISGAGSRPSQGSADVGLSIGLAGSGITPGNGEGSANFDLSLSLDEVDGFAISPIIPVRVFTPEEILTGNRSTKFYLDVLSNSDAPLYRLDGVTDGELDWIANAVVKGGGRISVRDVNQNVDWLNVHIRPVMLIEGLPSQNLGIFLVSEAPESYGNGRSWDIKLLDNTTILDQDTINATYAIAAGQVVTDAIVTLLTGAGITNYAVTPSAATLAADVVWGVGTSKLRIINDLLAIINYFSLYSNFDGQMRGDPYILPANRPLFYEFLDDNKSIYIPEFNRDNDIWKIPNRVTLVGIGDGTTAALTSTVDNVNPASPYSQVTLGRVKGITETGIEAASQAILDSLAAKRLNELTSPTAGVEISHAPVPGLAVNQAARFRRLTAGIDHRHVVSKTAINLNGKALATTTLTQVADV